MATLSSFSTFAEIEAEYMDTASYHETDDASLARRFVTACRFLLLKLPKALSSEPGAVNHNPELIRDELKSAKEFIDVHDEGDLTATFVRGRAP